MKFAARATAVFLSAALLCGMCAVSASAVEIEQGPVTVDEEKSGYVDQGADSYYNLYLTINDAAGAEVEAVLSQAATEMINESGYVLPGDSYDFHVYITNESNHAYAYQEGSFSIAPQDLSSLNPDIPLTSFTGFDGKQIPLTYVGAIPVADKSICQGLFGVGSKNVTADMMFGLYDTLAEKGYT